MTGEMQRIVNIQSTAALASLLSNTTGPFRSKDGWAVGGVATTFTTGIGGTINGTMSPFNFPTPMNNGCYFSPGSAHSGGAYFGFGDARVRFINQIVDMRTFALLGSMADYQVLPKDAVETVPGG